jgi:hypothetical protein
MTTRTDEGAEGDLYKYNIQHLDDATRGRGARAGGQCKREIEIGNADRDVASLAKKSAGPGQEMRGGDHELPPLSNMPLSLHGSIVSGGAKISLV